jgi:hypothetical protein
VSVALTPTFTVETDSRRLLLQFNTLTTSLRTNLRETVTTLTNQLLSQVHSLEPARTGVLRSSTQSFVNVSEDHVLGGVRIRPTGSAHRTAAAFGALEYGAHRFFVVSAYRRGRTMVSAYERHANIQARRFLRGPAEAMREQATKALEAAVTKSVEEGNSA